ncbi:MAG: D-aminoacyl-tRNA deacylase, partial [Nitrosopumilus sp.]|nr:D-aminoacyl-tRNA deacylase [Nitrosopumilus sp.]
EATHHGPTALTKPCIFIEIGTTEKQWTDVSLCNSVANLVHQVMSQPIEENPVAICFGGTHYPSKFTNELLDGKYALGTVIPKHALESLDEKMFSHILRQNYMAKVALLDWNGLGSNKKKITNLLESTDLEVIKL